MIINSLGGRELDQNKYVRIEGLKKYIVINDKEIALENIPSIQVNNNELYFAQIGMNMYIVYHQKTIHTYWFYIIEQAVDHGKMKIENIYTTTIVGLANIFEQFYRYDKEFESHNIQFRLCEMIEHIDVILDKEYLQGKIIEYLDNIDIVREKFIEQATSLNVENKYVYKGKEYGSVGALSKATGVDYQLLWNRLKRGMTIEKAIEKPIDNRGGRASKKR